MNTPIRCPLDNGLASFCFKKKGYPHYRCDACGLWFVSPLPEPESLQAFYGEEYIPRLEDPVYQDRRRADVQWGVEMLLRDLSPDFSTRDRTLLDVGCGVGFHLEALQGDFRRVRGLEVAERLRNFSRMMLGLEVFEGEAAAIPLEKECEDVVLLWHVLEHLLDPPAGLREIRRVLVPGGLLIISTPNPESLTARLLGKRWFAFNPPAHLHLFSPRLLVWFLEREGFEVLTVRTNTLLLHHFLEAWRKPEVQEAAMNRSTMRLKRAVRHSRLLKGMMDATNTLLTHWHVGDMLRVTACKRA